MTKRALRLALVDDHNLFRQGLSALLERAGMEIVWQAGSTRDAVDAAANTHADVVTMDLSMPGTSGIDATRALLKQDPATRVLILTMHSGEEFVVQAFLAGATGFALKAQSFEEIVEAIHRTSEGKMYLAPSIPRATLVEYNRRIQNVSSSPLDRLSRRERQVFELAAENKSNAEIAHELGISVKTVETHRLAVHKKLGVRSAAGLVRMAALAGILHR